MFVFLVEGARFGGCVWVDWIGGMGGWMGGGWGKGRVRWEEVGKGDRSVTRSQPRLEAGWRWGEGEEVNERGCTSTNEQQRRAELSSPPQPCGRLRGIGRSAAAWVRGGAPIFYLLSSISYHISRGCGRASITNLVGLYASWCTNQTHHSEKYGAARQDRLGQGTTLPRSAPPRSPRSPPTALPTSNVRGKGGL